MASKNQIEANKRNALKSTGPKTKNGKAIASLNAMKHGLRSQEVTLLPTEDEEAFHKLRDSLLDDLKPEGELENLLVEQVITASWRLRRILNIETGILNWKYYEIQIERIRGIPSSYDQKDQYEYIGRMLLESDEDNNEELSFEEQEVKEKMETMKNDTSMIGQAFSKAQDSLSKLSRYEASVERSLYKALAELERVQSRRRVTDAPMVIDVPESLD